MLILPRPSSVTVWPPLPLARARLNQCLMLALMLHLLLMVMIGTTPGGTARPGEGVWGLLNVTLTGARSAPVMATAAEPAPPPVDAGPVGPAAHQRFGGAVRTQPEPRPAEPGAAELGRWSPAPAEQLNGPATEAPALPALAPMPETGTVRLQAPQDTVERLQKPAPPAPALPKPEPDLLKALPAAEPVAAPAPAQAPVPAPAALPVPAPQPEPSPAPPVELPPPPSLRSLPEPAPLTRRAPAEQPLDLPPVQAVPEPLAVPKALPEIAPTPGPAPAPAPSASPAPRPEAAPPTAKASPAPGGPSAPTAAPPSLLPIAPPVGAPLAGPRLGHDVATPPSASASAPRAPLDLRLPVHGPLSRQGSNRLLDLMPHPPDTKSRLEKGIEKAGRGDCRNEHADAGLLAVIPLAADAARDKGCKW